MISVESISKCFDRYWAVRDLSFGVGPGEILGFLGPNGAGKTTTMKMIMGLLQPTTGRATVEGIDPQLESVKVKHSVGYLPDVPFLYDHLTPNETIAFLGGLYGIPSDEVARRAERIWTDLDISERADELIVGLSRGARKKVALAMALLHRPRALLLDEPTAGLDPQTVRTLKDRIVAEARSGTAIIFSSHQLEVVEELATQLLVLNRGQAVMFLPMERALEQARAQGQTLEGLFLSLTDTKAARASTS
jgi:ABC-2 type transport system ATP-binding protein